MKAVALKFEAKKLVRFIKGTIEKGRFKENKKIGYLIDNTEPAMLERPGFLTLLGWMFGAKLKPFYVFDHGRAVSMDIDKVKKTFKFGTPQALADIDEQKTLHTAMSLTGMTTMKEYIMYIMCLGLGAFGMYFVMTSGMMG